MIFQSQTTIGFTSLHFQISHLIQFTLSLSKKGKMIYKGFQTTSGRNSRPVDRWGTYAKSNPRKIPCGNNLSRSSNGQKIFRGNPPRRGKDMSSFQKLSKGRGRAGKSTRRSKPGNQAIREIKKLQKSTDKLLPLLPLVRIIREIAQEIMPDVRFTKAAVEVIHEALEEYGTKILHCANEVCCNSGRQTISRADLKSVCYVLWMCYPQYGHEKLENCKLSLKRDD